MKNLNIRTLNEIRPTANPHLFKLIIKNACEIEIFDTQVNYLNKKTWVFENGKIVTLIKDEIVTIENFLSTLPKNHYSTNGEVDNRILPKTEKVVNVAEVKKHEKLETVNIGKSKSKVYFDSNTNRYFVTWKEGIKTIKRYFSVNKYGSKLAKEKAENLMNFKNTTL